MVSRITLGSGKPRNACSHSRWSRVEAVAKPGKRASWPRPTPEKQVNRHRSTRALARRMVGLEDEETDSPEYRTGRGPDKAEGRRHKGSGEGGVYSGVVRNRLGGSRCELAPSSSSAPRSLSLYLPST